MRWAAVMGSVDHVMGEGHLKAEPWFPYLHPGCVAPPPARGGWGGGRCRVGEGSRCSVLPKAGVYPLDEEKVG